MTGPGAGPWPTDTVAVPGLLLRGSTAHRPDRVELRRRTWDGRWLTVPVTYAACADAWHRPACTEHPAAWAAHVGAVWCPRCWPAGGGA